MIRQTTKRELIRQAIAELADANGVVTSKAVFEAARSPNSILHHEFEWDGDKAIVALGMQRAAELIRSVRVEIVVQSHKIVAPYYVNDPRDSQTGVYQPLATVKNDETMKRGVLINEISRIEAAIKRASAISGVLDLSSEFEQMMTAVEAARIRLDRAA